MGHVINAQTSEQSPLLLLFLDCTWQLLQQFPEEFEFSETFLTTIWDAVFQPIFDTFQFNSERDRQAARINEQLILRPVWDWGEQFSDKDILLFANPFYKKPSNDRSDVRRTMMAGGLAPAAATNIQQLAGGLQSQRQTVHLSPGGEPILSLLGKIPDVSL